MLDIIKDTLIDGLKLLPFLFIAFLIIEFLEHKLTSKNKKIILKSKKFGPIFGSLLGLFPQCGFSVMATNLYITRIISLGTLIAICLSTSDEMLPILLSQKVDILLIIKLLSIKLVIGMIAGIIIDLVYRKKIKYDYHICDEKHCHCEKSILSSSIKHTLQIFVFIILSSFIINIIFSHFGEEYLSTLLLKNTIFGPFITSLIGLIPNCGASVVITELYLNNAISLGATISGLLTGSGVAVLVLFRYNKNVKENITILSLLYGIGVVSGIIIQLIGV